MVCKSTTLPLSYNTTPNEDVRLNLRNMYSPRQLQAVRLAVSILMSFVDG